MIRRLIILLLIVGCVPTKPTAQFYIGMTEEEFVNTNDLNTDGVISQKKNNIAYKYAK